MSYSLLEQLAPSAATLSTLYTVPVGVATVRLGSITACNTSGAERNVRLAIVKGGGSINSACYVLYDCALPRKKTLEWSQAEDVVLLQGDAIMVYADGADVAFGAFGEEERVAVVQPANEVFS